MKESGRIYVGRDKNLAVVAATTLLAVLILAISLVLACSGQLAKFEVTSIDIIPSKVTIGETVTAAVQVKNVGDSEGVYIVKLTMDGSEVERKTIKLSPGFSGAVKFILVVDSFGTHNMAVDGSAATLAVVPLYSMKGVSIDVSQEDFEAMRSAGIEIVTMNWGMETSVSEAKEFLDKARASGLKVVLDGGFSQTAWGFTDDDWDSLPKGKKPIWQREKVQSWVKALKDHPAVFGWDISNEAGMNLPSGNRAENSEWPDSAVTLRQLKQARADVLEIDPDKPILIRMAPWDLNESPFGSDNPFASAIADIVMLNIYSNYAPGYQIEQPNEVEESGPEYIKAIKKRDPKVKIWVALGAFEEPGVFQRPAANELARDIESAMKLPYIAGLGFYLWGPVYLSNNETWYLPETGADLWDVIQYYARAGLAPTQTTTAPSPKVIDINVSPEELHLGDYAVITVKVKNDGGTAEWQTVNISFPQNANDIHIVEHNLDDADVYPRGYIGWRDYCTAQDCKFRYPLAEGYKEPWPAGESGYLVVKVKPEVSGEFKFYVKSVVGRQPDGNCVSWAPALGVKDQQGEFVYERTIRVKTSP